MKPKKRFTELKFSDAFLFAATLEDEELCRDVLERILGITIKKVRVHKESSVLISPEYRGIRMDVFADDEAGTIFDVEMQTTNEGNLPMRSRCYQSQMDVVSLEPGDDFNRLPRSFVIFICTFDPFGRGRYCYTYESVCREDGEVLGDGTCKVFLNTRGKDETSVSSELVEFLHFVENSDYTQSDGTDVLLNKLQSRIAYLKQSRRLEERYMLFGEMLDEERKEGRQEGRAEMLALIEAMQADDKQAELSRLQSDPQFLVDMLECYHIVKHQINI